VAVRLSARRPEAVLLLLLSACLVLLSVEVRRPEGMTAGERWVLDVAAPFVAVAGDARSAATSASEWASTHARLVHENESLKARVGELQAEVLRLRDAERDKARLLELFGAHPNLPEAARPAHLIALQSAGPFRSGLLDRGRNDGVEQNGVVVSPAGLLGRVVALGERTARVQLLSDRTAAVGVLFARGGRAAVARGDGGGGVAVLYVPRSADVQPNDVLVTAGTDGLYPKDLPVGRIASVRRGGPSLFLELPVTTAADPNLESLVLVLPPVPSTNVPDRPPGADRPAPR
jgi:rod shape-determining protein MreC